MTGKSFLLKHPFDREKHRMLELKVSHGNGLKANLSILSAFERLSI